MSQIEKNIYLENTNITIGVFMGGINLRPNVQQMSPKLVLLSN